MFYSLGPWRRDAAKTSAKRATAVPPVLAKLFLAKQRYNNLASATAGAIELILPGTSICRNRSITNIGFNRQGTGFCNTYKQFLACRALFGVAMGGLYGNAAATALEDCPSEARGIISGMLQQGVSHFSPLNHQLFLSSPTNSNSSSNSTPLDISSLPPSPAASSTPPPTAGARSTGSAPVRPSSSSSSAS